MLWRRALRYILPFRLSFPSSPHPSYSLHPSLHLNLHHHQDLNYGGPALNPVPAGGEDLGLPWWVIRVQWPNRWINFSVSIDFVQFFRMISPYWNNIWHSCSVHHLLLYYCLITAAFMISVVTEIMVTYITIFHIEPLFKFIIRQRDKIAYLSVKQRAVRMCDHSHIRMCDHSYWSKIFETTSREKYLIFQLCVCVGSYMCIIWQTTSDVQMHFLNLSMAHRDQFPVDETKNVRNDESPLMNVSILCAQNPQYTSSWAECIWNLPQHQLCCSICWRKMKPAILLWLQIVN